MDEAPELRRSLFGYRRDDVESLLDARERMFERVTEELNRTRAETAGLRADLEKARRDVQTARDETQSVRGELDAQLNDVRTELEGARAELARVEEQRRDAETRATGLEIELREARREVVDLTERLRVADSTEADLRARLDEASATGADTRDLGAVLEATQEAIARIMSGARRTAEEDLSRVQRMRDEMQLEIERVRSWRDRITPVSRDIASEIEVAQAQMSQTAERVGEALRPMSDALSSLSRHLEQLARVADPSVLGLAAPDRVDLVSHENDQAVADAATPEQAQEIETPPHEAATAAPFHPDPWPDPWR